MALREILLPWDAQPQEYAEPSRYWLSRGLRSLYILDAASWQINQVTGLVGGAVAGTGPTFPNGWLTTPGTSSNGATLAHGLSTDITLPITLIVGWRRISGAVSWSLLDDISNWTGWYGANSGEVAATNNNSFDGSLVLGGTVAAVCHAAANNLYGASPVGVVTDTAVAAPAAVTPSTVALGWARRGLGSNDNPAVAEFTFFAAIQGAVSIGELSELARNPGLLFEPRRIFVPVSAVGGATADLSATGNSGTFSGAANSPATATLAQTGGSGILSASAGAGASAALVATGDSGTLSASAYTPALASLAATGASGIFVGSAFSEATAALSATGSSGTLSASAGAEASASLAATGGSGTLAAEAFVQAVATLAATGVSGSLIASAWTTISASLAATGGSGELSATAGEPVVATRVLSSYRPLPPPVDPKDFGQWAMNELLTIARHLADGRDFDLLNTIHAPPSKPREGMVVHADGTNWDPGSGAGRYERVGGAWVKL